MKRLVLYLGLVFLFAGCGLMGPRIPLTPEERQARDIRSHCRDLGNVEAEKFDALKGPVTGGAYGGALRGSQKSDARNVAYRECMYRYGYRP